MSSHTARVTVPSTPPAAPANPYHHRTMQTPLMIIAAVAVAGNVAIAAALGLHPLRGLLWSAGSAATIAALYLFAVIVTA